MKALPRRFPLSLSLMATLLAAVLVALIVWSARLFMLSRRLPVRQRESDRPIDYERPRAVPRKAQEGEWPLQLTNDGTGPLYHRRYRADIVAPGQSAGALMARMQRDPDFFGPSALARFEKTKGDAGGMRVDDEYYIHIVGPWDGPVRVIDVQPTSFTFVTLEGHLEAGEIQFRFLPHPTLPDVLRFEILSWARSRDKLVDLAYNKLKIARRAQTSMWTQFCESVVEQSEGKLLGNIDVVSEERPFRGEVIPSE